MFPAHIIQYYIILSLMKLKLDMRSNPKIVLGLLYHGRGTSISDIIIIFLNRATYLFCLINTELSFLPDLNN